MGLRGSSRPRLLYFVLAAFLYSVFSPLAHAEVERDLETVYRVNPGLRTNTSDPDTFKEEARRILGDEGKVTALMNLMSGDLEHYQSVRAQVIHHLVRTEKPYGRTVFTGNSVTGMVGAAVWAQSGYQVDCVDIREHFVRNIQWANRQAVVDELASIDPDLAKKFLDHITHLEGGYVLGHPDGTRVGTDEPRRNTPGDPRNIPRNGADTLAQKAAGIADVKLFEQLLYDFVTHHPNIKRRQGTVTIGQVDPATGRHAVTINEPAPGGGFRPVETFVPTIISINEGSNSQTRDELLKRNGFRMLPTSPSRPEFAGVVLNPNFSGRLVRRYRNDTQGKGVAITMSNTNSPGIWVISDIDPAKITATDPAERKRQLEAHFREIAAGNLGVPVGALDDSKIVGAVADREIVPFDLMQRISPVAAFGTNVVLSADAVGNAHWSVGGGGTIGSVSHVERHKALITDLHRGVSPNEAIARYSAGVISDTHAWGAAGFFDFYDHMTAAQGKDAYYMAVKAYEDGLVATPAEALEVMFPEGRATANIGERLATAPDRLKRFAESRRASAGASQPRGSVGTCPDVSRI